MKQIQGKRALLTGASRGIGIHIAHALATKGVSLVLTARNEDQLQEVAKSLKNDQVAIECFASDMSSHKSLDQLVDKATENGKPIDLLINNAGIYQYGIYDETSFADVEKMIQVNLTGLMYLTHRVLPGMKSRGLGHIVHISSLAGLSGSAYSETYCATKHAVVGFNRSMRASLKQEKSPVSTSVVCPGIVDETGIFKKLEIEEDVRAPVLMGKSDPRTVANAVIRCIERDLPEVIVNPTAMRPGIAFASLFPGLMEKLSLKLGLHGFLNPNQKD